MVIENFNYVYLKLCDNYESLKSIMGYVCNALQTGENETYNYRLLDAMINIAKEDLNILEELVNKNSKQEDREILKSRLDIMKFELDDLEQKTKRLNKKL